MAYKKSGNIVLDKSFYFGCDIVLFCKDLKVNHNYEIASQLIRSGTSVGANIREAQRAVSAKDFKYKLGISLKEADETLYWLDIIEETLMEIPNKLRFKCEELIKLLVTIIKNS